MSAPVTAIPASSLQNYSRPSSDSTRPSANFHPSIWGHRFIAYAAEFTEVDDNVKQQAQALKEEVRRMLVSAADLPQKLELIDSVQRLGISYHFEGEIDESLQKIYKICTNNDIVITLDCNLSSLALLFRLPRQHAYHISPDMFNKFKDNEGNFNEDLTRDVQGMLGLYEAAQVRVHGEDILEEALDFSCTHLKSLTTQLSPLFAAHVNHSLTRPLRKNLPRLEARYYISFYEEDPSHNETLLKFAKLDFNMLQKMHQKEVGNISLWWKELDFSSKLSFARDRIAEGYLWSLGIYSEPQYSLGRSMITKVGAIITIIDDIYDSYGTIEELELFTEAIERWDICCLDFLPEYMKICYKALLGVYEETEEEMTKEGKAYCVDYAKDYMKQLIKANFIEAKWFNGNYIPTVEEYMTNATISCGYYMVAATSLIGMGDIVTEEVFKWLNNGPKVMTALTVLFRLVNDLASNESEQNKGDVASILECYMKQRSVSRQDAIDELGKQVVNAWKEINGECLRLKEVPMPFLKCIVNHARVVDVFYKDEDCYTNPGGAMKNYITALLVDPLPLGHRRERIRKKKG